MGFSFVVGQPEAVFQADMAAAVRAVLKDKLGVAIAGCEEPFYSDEIGWSWWGALQERAGDVLGPDAVPHLQFVSAWQGVYLPVALKPQEIAIPHASEPLQCAGVEELFEELEQFGTALDLPVEEPDLSDLAASYRDDESLVDEGQDVQAYLQAMISATEAVRRNEPMWLVK